MRKTGVRDTSDYANKMAEKAGKWAASQEGKQQMESVINLIEEVTVRLSEVRRVDEKSLQRPVTM